MCTLRRFAGAALLGAPGLSAPNVERSDPFGALVPDWQEVLAFDLTVNATTEEGIASRLIYGPFLIEEIGFRSSAAGGSSQQFRLGVGDSSPSPQAIVGSDSGIPSSVATDSSRTVGTYYATTVFERHQLRWLSRTDQTRLLYILNNTTAGAVTLVGHVLITHLRPAPLAVTPR